MRTKLMLGTFLGRLLAACVCGAVEKEPRNILPDADFELDTTHRHYALVNPRPLKAPRFDMLTTNDAFHGRQCLRLTGTNWLVSSRLVHAEPGPHTFSFYAKATDGGRGTVRLQLNADAIQFGQRLPSTNVFFRVASNQWTRYSVTWDLPPSRDNWYSAWMGVTPLTNGAILFDALQWERGTNATSFTPAQPLEAALYMDGDFSRIFPVSVPLPPLRLQVVNHLPEPATAKYEVTVKDFWQTNIWQTNVTVTLAGATRKETVIPMPIRRKGPFRVELHEAHGLLQDELIFGILPDITHPVLGTQHAYHDPELRYLYRTLGFANAGMTRAVWPVAQPRGPDQWSWDGIDEYYRNLRHNLPDQTYVWLFGIPAWVAPRNQVTALFSGDKDKASFPFEGFLNYVETAARRYPDWTLWQVWNEPYYWPAESYVELLKRCREVFDRVNPAIKIVAPTIHGRSTEWMDRFLKAGGLKYCDIFAVHAYPASGGFAPESLATVQRWAWYDGNTNRPIWNTESCLQPGCISSWYTGLRQSNTGTSIHNATVPQTHTAEEGAERWARLYLLQTAMGFERFFSHVAPAAMGPTSRLPRMADMRQAEPDGSRPPVALAWSVAGHRVGDWRGLGVQDVSANLRMLLFAKEGRAQAVLWTLDHERLEVENPIASGLFYSYDDSIREQRGRQRKIIDREMYSFAVSLAPESVTVYDLFDNPVAPQWREGRLVLPVSCRPLYVESASLTPDQLRKALAGGELAGMRAFQAQLGLGRDAAGQAAAVVKVLSCSSRPLAVQGTITALTPELTFANSNAALRLQPLRERSLDFAFDRLPPVIDGAPGLSARITDGETELAVDRNPLWLTTAPWRTGILPDGDLGEWTNLPTLTMNRREQVAAPEAAWSGPADCSADVMAAWDRTNLYVAVRVNDSVFTDRRGYGGDAVELFFDAELMGDIQNREADTDDLHYTANPPVGDDWPVGSLKSKGGVEGGQLAVKRTAAGYDMEIVIPWEHLKAAGFIPRSNAVLGFCPAICDFDHDNFTFKMVWTGHPRINMDPTGMGLLRLVGDPEAAPPVPAEWARGAISAWQFDHPRRLFDLGSAQADGTVTDAVYRDDAPDGPRLLFDAARKSQVRFAGSQYDLGRKTFEIEFMGLATNRASELLWVEPSGQGWRYQGRIDAEGRLQVCLVDFHDQSQPLVRSETVVRVPGRWFTAACQWDAGARRIELWIDGQREAEAQTEIQPLTHDICIGGAGEENRWFTGAIRRARILDRWLYAAPLSSPAAAAPGFFARYALDRISGGTVRDEGPLQIDGRYIGPLTMATDAQRGEVLTFNGVDNMIWVPAGFCGPQDRISLWIRPDDAPGESAAARFRERLGGKTWEDVEFIRLKLLPTGEPDWGDTTGLGRRFRSSISSNRYVFACDSPTIGSQLQAWLEPSLGRLLVKYREPGTGRSLTLTSRTAVWQKGKWSHIQFQFDALARKMSLLINGAVEDETALPLALPAQWISFSAGGSRRDGLPFCGAMTGLEIASELSPDEWLLPAGTLRFGEQEIARGIRLPAGFQALGLAEGEDEAGIETHGPGTAVLWLRLSAPGRGVAIQVPVQAFKQQFQVTLDVEAAAAGAVRLLAGHKAEPRTAFDSRVLELTPGRQRLASEVLARNRDGMIYIMLLFETPGGYSIRDVRVR